MKLKCPGSARGLPTTVWLALSALALLLSSSCAEPSRAPLRVGVLLWPPYELGFLAREQGLLEDDRIALVEYQSPAVAVRDYRNGVLDVVTLTLNYVLQIAQSEPDQRIILSIDESKGGDLIMARPGIATVAALRGQRVGVEASALGAYVLARALAMEGIEVAELEIVPVDLADQARRFEVGEIDAVATYEPFAEQLRALGGHAIFDSARLRGEIVDVLLTRQRTIDERVGDLQHLVHGWLLAERYYRTNPERANEIMARRAHLSAERFAELMQTSARLHGRVDNLRWLSGEQPELSKVMAVVYENSRQYGLLPHEVALDELIAGQLVPTAGEEVSP